MNKSTHTRLPEWLKNRCGNVASTHDLKSRLRKKGLHTVCEAAKCPNIGECFERGTATFMIMGEVCTRNCRFCNVKHGVVQPLDHDEPARVATEISELKLRHAVITSVTRDDLPDGGATHFRKTIEAIRSYSPKTTIEVLTPDFEGREKDISEVCSAAPQIFNHNIETVERLTPSIRSMANYRRSLAVLEFAKSNYPDILVKSGIIVGLGERREEILETLADLKAAGCEIVTIGQYLRPSRDAIAVHEYLEPEYFTKLEEDGKKLGFKYIFAGPLVRSSYMAEMVSKEI